MITLNRTAFTTLTAVAATAFAAFATFSMPAVAGEATYELPQAVAVAKSRTEVRAEVLQARAAGTLARSEADLQKDTAVASQRSRAEVTAELRAAGPASAMGEPHDFDVPQVRPAAAATRIEAQAAR
jgi:hypothetical protein